MISSSFRTDIQGLRAIAVLGVMIFHYNPNWLSGGFVGVDVFLVISGFLITSILLSKRNNKDYSFNATLKYFYISRLKRIVPAYLFMLVVVSLVAAVLFLPKDFYVFSDSFEQAVRFTSNNYYADFGNYFAPESYEQPLLHTWSLAVEIQFYLLAPFIALILPIHWLKWVFTVLLVALSLIAEYRLRVLAIEQETYYSLYARLPEFFAGSLAALYAVRNPDQLNNQDLMVRYTWLPGLGFILVFLAFFAQPALGSFPGLSASLPVIGCVILLLSGSSKGWVSQILSNRVLVWLGALSYSLYLWHWPVLAYLRYYSGGEVLSLTYSLLFIVLTLLFSLLSYYVIERIFHVKTSSSRQIIGWPLLVIVVLATSESMAKVNQAFTPERLPIEYHRYADPESICHGKIVGDCLRGDLSSDIEVLVLGDSHGAMLNHFFDYLGKELGFKARIITASSCVTIDKFDIGYISEWAREDCFSQIEVATKYARNARNIAIAGMWSYQFISTQNVVAVEDFIKENSDKNILIFEQVPELLINPHKSVRFKQLGVGSGVGYKIGWELSNKVIQNLAVSGDFVKVLNVGELTKTRTLPYVDEELLYFDASHINQVGAEVYARLVKEDISRWLGM